MMNWTQEKCSLAQLRQNVVNTLQMLSTKTSILTDPKQLEGQVMTMLSEEEVKKKKSWRWAGCDVINGSVTSCRKVVEASLNAWCHEETFFVMIDVIWTIVNFLNQMELWKR